MGAEEVFLDECQRLRTLHGLDIHVQVDADASETENWGAIAAYNTLDREIRGFRDQIIKLTIRGAKECARHELAHAYAHQKLGHDTEDPYDAHHGPEWEEACRVMEVPSHQCAPMEWLKPEYRNSLGLVMMTEGDLPGHA